MPRRPRYADVAATLALVLALGGTAAYAADALPKNSVGKKQLKKDAITSKKIKNGKVKGEDLANDTITGSKVAPGTIGLSDLASASVNGGKVVDKSLSLDDVAGSSGTTTVTLDGLAPGACVPVVIVVPGAAASQFAMIGQASGSSAKISLTPARPTAGQVTSQLCNVGADPITTGSVVLKAITLG